MDLVLRSANSDATTLSLDQDGDVIMVDDMSVMVGFVLTPKTRNQLIAALLLGADNGASASLENLLRAAKAEAYMDAVEMIRAAANTWEDVSEVADVLFRRSVELTT